MNLKDKYWLIGLLEGEGCFSFNKTTTLIQLGTIDKDIVTKVSRLLECKVLGPYRYNRRPNEKPMFRIALSGVKAAKTMTEIRDHMSERRKEQIDYALQMARNRKRGLNLT